MNSKVVVYPLFFILLGIVFSFCGRPKDVLNRKDMEKLMYDVYIAEAMIENDYRNFDTPDKKEALIGEIFKKHKITQAQWDTSLSWYSDKIDIYLRMNDSVKARIQRQQKLTERIMNQEYAQQQSIAQRNNSPSYIPANYSFDEVNPVNGFRFRLDTAGIAKKIDSPDFDFTFDVSGISADTYPNLRAMLMLNYKDTVVYRYEKISENRTYALHGQKYIRKDTINDTIRNITGFVRLQDPVRLYKNIRLNNIFLGNPNDATRHGKPDTAVGELPLREKMLREEDAAPQ